MEYKFIKLVKLKDDKKKYKAVFKNLKTGKEKNVKFGASGYSHYTEGHLDEKRRLNYELRHKKNENWNNPLTAGYWSYFYLWKFKTFEKAKNYILKDLKKLGFY